MILEISNSRRAEIKSYVISVLENYGKPFVPVKIGALIRSMHNIKLITYVKVKSFAPRQIQRRLFAALVTLSRKVFRPWHKWF